MEPGMEPGLLRTTGTLTSVLGDSLITYGYRTHVNKTLAEVVRFELTEPSLTRQFSRLLQ